MKGLLVDRLGFERIVDGADGVKVIVPRRFAPGTSEFHWHGPVVRDGEELHEFREVDDMSEELKREHSTIAFLRDRVRALEGTIRGLNEENGALALDLRRSTSAKEDS